MNDRKQRSGLRVLEGLPRHVVGFLLIRRLEHRDLGELGVEAAVLFVLRGVHAGIVRDGQHQPPGDSCQGRVHKGIGGRVEPDVLHRHERPAIGVAHAERFLVRHLLVGGPERADPHAAPDRRLNVFEDLRGRGAGIGERAPDAGVDRTKGHGFVAEE